MRVRERERERKREGERERERDREIERAPQLTSTPSRVIRTTRVCTRGGTLNYGIKLNKSSQRKL